MYKTNETSAYMTKLDTDDCHFLRGEARKSSASGQERKHRQHIVEETKWKVEEKQVKAHARQSKVDARQAKLKGLTLILDPNLLELVNMKILNSQLDDQLDWYHEFYDTGPRAEKMIPIKTQLNTKAKKTEALIDVIRRYNADPLQILPSLKMDGIQDDNAVMEADAADIMMPEGDVDLDMDWEWD